MTGLLRELPVTAQVPSSRVTILHIYGSMFSISAYLPEAALPAVLGSARAALNIKLGGLGSAASTFIKVSSVSAVIAVSW